MMPIRIVDVLRPFFSLRNRTMTFFESEHGVDGSETAATTIRDATIAGLEDVKTKLTAKASELRSALKADQTTLDALWELPELKKHKVRAYAFARFHSRYMCSSCVLVFRTRSVSIASDLLQ